MSFAQLWSPPQDWGRASACNEDGAQGTAPRGRHSRIELVAKEAAQAGAERLAIITAPEEAGHHGPLPHR